MEWLSVISIIRVLRTPWKQKAAGPLEISETLRLDAVSLNADRRWVVNSRFCLMVPRFSAGSKVTKYSSEKDMESHIPTHSRSLLTIGQFMTFFGCLICHRDGGGPSSLK